KHKTAGSPVNTVRPVNIADSKPIVNYTIPISNAFKRGHLQVIRPYNKYSAYKKTIFNKMVNTVRVKDTTARERVVLSEYMGREANAVKASACWKEYKEKGVIDNGCSRHITGNKGYLIDYEDYDGIFVSFGDVDGKKVIINEASIRRDLRLDNVEGTACLPNVVIFKELARMGYEKPSQKLTFYKASFSPQWKFLIHTILQCLSAKPTAWNEFSNTMASAIICLANNQKFNFSKYILENMVNNLEAGVKFYMFLRFVQVFVNHQLGDMSYHKGIFVNPSLTKKVFSNMKWVGTGFSKVITPLFETMIVQAPEEVGDIPTDTQDIPILTQPSSSQPKRKHKPRRKQKEAIEVPHTEPQAEERVPTPSYDPIPSAKIKKLKKRVKKLEGEKNKRTHGLKRLYKVRLSAKVKSSKDKEEEDKDQDLFGVHDLDGDEVFVDVTTAFSFYDDHIEEISSGSTTTQSDISLTEYDSFIFDLSNDQFPPTNRSDFTHEELYS
nr:hypothetical protein [Tanacetum cinerariifolium]